MKPLKFIGSSLIALRTFPADARRTAGFELNFVQRGLPPSDWKPLPAIGPGVREIRIHSSGEWRVIYVANFFEAVYVLHAFAKKARRAPSREIALARNRYRQLGELR